MCHNNSLYKDTSINTFVATIWCQWSPAFVQKSDCGFPDFSRTKLRLFPDFSRHFVHLYVNKNITKLAFIYWNFLYNVFFYSVYRMWLKFLNSEFHMNCKKFSLWQLFKTAANTVNSLTATGFPRLHLSPIFPSLFLNFLTFAWDSLNSVSFHVFQISGQCVKYLSTGVDMSTRVADSNGADNFAVAQRAHLACVAWNSRSNERVRRKRHGLHLSVCTHVEWVSSASHTIQTQTDCISVCNNSSVILDINIKKWAWMPSVCKTGS